MDTQQFIGLMTLLLGAGLAMTGAVALVHLNAATVVSRYPYRPEQTVTFDTPAAYVLHTENAPWSLTILQCTLHEAATGAEVTGYQVLTRGMTSGVAVRRFFVRIAGEHILRAPAAKETAGAAFVFTTASPFRGGRWIAAIMAGAVLALSGALLMAA